ncbi:MAG: hypothetical protein N0E54_19580 [Candidatus Thiodiazotropha taylori]|nr:hypothetical protein [Candidatus Thiodiazotropha endolucinida]MCW4230951.1 hypothetical protein [Candidatus Thiodiazotropha taylori]
MPSIKFYGPALVDGGQDNPDGTMSLVNDTEVLKALDGLKYEDEEFSDYLSDGEETASFSGFVSGGTLLFQYDDTSNTLIGGIEYVLSRALNTNEVEALTEYTIEQLLDAIGSNFSQERALENKPAPFINHEELGIEQSS